MEWTQPFDPASSGSEASPRSWSVSGVATPSPPSSPSSSARRRRRSSSGTTTCYEAEEQPQPGGRQEVEEQEDEEDQPLLWAIELVLDRVGAASKWSAPTLPWATIQALRQLAPSSLVTRSAGDGLLDRLNMLGLLNWVHNRSPAQWPRGAILRALAALVVDSPAPIRPAGRRLLELARLHMAVAPLCADPPDWGGFSSAVADDDLWASAVRDNGDGAVEAGMGVRARLAQLLADIREEVEEQAGAEARQAWERGREAAVALVAAVCPLDAFRRQFEDYMGAFHARLPPPFLDELAHDIRSGAYHHPPGARAEDEKSIDLTPAGPGSGDEEEAERERQPTPYATATATATTGTGDAPKGDDGEEEEEEEEMMESGPPKNGAEEMEEWEDAQQPDRSGDREAPPIGEKENANKDDDDDEQEEAEEDEEEEEDERPAGSGERDDRRGAAKDKRRRSEGSAEVTGLPKRRKLLTDEHDDDDEVRVNTRVKSHWHRRRSTGSSGTTATRTAAFSTASAGRRRRRRWTEDEVANLLAGVKKFGVGHWKHIVEHYDFGGRTAVDLKDKYRNLEREWEKQATHHRHPAPPPAAPAAPARRVSAPDTNTSLDDDIEEWTPSGGKSGRGSSQAASAKPKTGAKRPNLDFIMTRGDQEEHRRSGGAEDSD